jgi:hypothetical protein
VIVVAAMPLGTVAASIDPFSAPICHVDAGDQQTPPQPAHDTHDCVLCVICQSHGAPVLLPLPAVAIPAPASAALVRFTFAQPRAPPAFPAIAAQPRGPPSLI